MKFRTSFTLILLASLLAALLGLARVQVAHAQTTITVSTCDESHLDAAISQANTDNAFDTIKFSCGGSATIPLSSTLSISGSMTLDGTGQSVTLDGQNQVGVLQVNSGVTFTLNALIIAHGSGYYYGGGLYNNSGTVSITNSTFAYNSARFDGGGLYNIGSVSISNSTFANNSAGVAGGGLLNNGGRVSISNSTFANNSAGYADGGGLYNGSGTVNITNSTFANNSAPQGGGGLFDFAGTVSISNSTFANNSAGGGGGLYQIGGMVGISGGIVDNNTGGNCAGVSSNGYNLESGSDCGFTGTGDLQNTDPKLDPKGLQSNGGPTQTIALQATSPAIDHVPAATCPATDQRGMTRPDDNEATCDIGAYESNYDDDLSLTIMPGTITTDATSPQGAVVTYKLPTVVDEDSPLPSVTCTPASGSTFPIGTTTVTCTAADSDDTPSSVSQTFTVTVKGAAAQISDLITEVKSYNLSSGLATSLIQKLNAVQTYLANGDTADACSTLVAFLSEVQAQSGKGLTTGEAQQLTTDATRIQAVIGC